MKKYYAVAALIALMMACEGKLSDEQRKEMKKQMELHKIKRVTDTEITEAAYATGRQLVISIEKLYADSAKVDSVARAHDGRVRWLVPGRGNALALEQQLIDAYLAQPSGTFQDNVQKVRNAAGDTDSILYTKPVLTRMADGSEKLEGVWNIWLSRKALILAMDKK